MGALAGALRRGPRRTAGLAALLAALVALAYGPAYGAGFVWDDDDYVTENPLLVEPGGLRRIWTRPRESPQYYPLVFTTFWIERRLWGLDPLGYHAVNVALHAAVAVLLWLALRRLRLPAAWWAAALFALHPVQVESVAWVTERKNVLSLALALGSLHAWLSDEDAPSDRRRRWWAASFGLFLASLLAKTVTCVLPVAFAFLRWLRRRRVTAPYLAALAPFLLVGLAFGLFTAAQEQPAIASRAADFALSPAQRTLVAIRAPLFYAGKILWPDPLVFFYPRWKLDPSDASHWLPLLAWAGAGALAVAAWRRWDARGPAVALGVYVVALFPALGFFDVFAFRYSFAADHWQYHANAALVALLVCGAAAVVRRPRWTGHALASGLALVLGVLTFRQARHYESLETLWAATVARNPAAWNVHVHLGNERLERGRIEEALEEFSRAALADPTQAEGDYNVGTTLAGLADDRRREARGVGAETAAAMLEEAARLDADAVAAFRRAIAAEPGHAKAHLGLGLALRRQGRVMGAIDEYRRALEIDQRYVMAWYNLGNALAERRELVEAEAAYRRAAELDPRHARARNNLGVLLAERGEHEEAVVVLREAVRIDAGHATATRRLAESLVALGRVEEARTELRGGIAANPGNAELEAALARIGR